MSNDPLNNPVSLSGELTESGVKAAANSRAVSGIDRLIGNFSDWVNVRLEKGISRRRAVMEGEQKLIAAAADYGVERMGRDEAFAERALSNHLEGIFEKQENKDAVAREALEDLRTDPPSENDANTGPDRLSDAFMDRLERYSEGANSDDLRKMWGRVLAREIRKPGTFGAKILRAMDEIEPETASLFQRFAAHRLDHAIPRCLLSEGLLFHQQQALIQEDLLVDPGLSGHIRKSTKIKFGRTDFDIFPLELPKILSISPTAVSGLPSDGAASVALIKSEGAPCIPIWMLTRLGVAICSVLPEVDNSRRFLAKVIDQVGDGMAVESLVQPDGKIGLPSDWVNQHSE